MDTGDIIGATPRSSSIPSVSVSIFGMEIKFVPELADIKESIESTLAAAATVVASAASGISGISGAGKSGAPPSAEVILDL